MLNGQFCFHVFSSDVDISGLSVVGLTRLDFFLNDIMSERKILKIYNIN